MIAHLSSEQLSECIVGQPSPILAQHVQDCPACRVELANFRETLGEFRGAVRTWSEEQARAALATPDAVAEAPAWAPSHQLAWALLIAAVCIFASFIIPGHGRDNTSSSDAVLLNQVDSEVSRTVPSSMEPLMKLVVQNQ